MKLNKPLNLVVITFVLTAVFVTYRVSSYQGALPVNLDQLAGNQQQPMPGSLDQKTGSIFVHEKRMPTRVPRTEGSHEEDVTNSRIPAGASLANGAKEGYGVSQDAMNVTGSQRPIQAATGASNSNVDATLDQTANLLHYNNSLVRPEPTNSDQQILGTGPGESDPQILGSEPVENEPQMLGIGPGENEPQIFGPGPGENEPQIFGPGPGENEYQIFGDGPERAEGSGGN